MNIPTHLLGYRWSHADSKFANTETTIAIAVIKMDDADIAPTCMTYEDYHDHMKYRSMVRLARSINFNSKGIEERNFTPQMWKRFNMEELRNIGDTIISASSTAENETSITCLTQLHFAAIIKPRT